MRSSIHFNMAFFPCVPEMGFTTNTILFLRSYFFRSFSFQMRYKSNTLLVITIENHKSFEVTKYFF